MDCFSVYVIQGHFLFLPTKQLAFDTKEPTGALFFCFNWSGVVFQGCVSVWCIAKRLRYTECTVAQLCPTPWAVARQAPLSMGLSRQEHWSGQPFPSAGDLPDPGMEPRSPAWQAHSLPLAPPLGKPFALIGYYKMLSRIPCAIQ